LLFRTQGEERVSSASLSPDGRILALGTAEGGDVLWVELRTGQLIRRFRGHAESVWAVAFSPRSLLCASASEDTTILLWPLGWPGEGPLSPAELTKRWKDLGDEDASVAYDAIGRLASEPDQALPFLRKRLLPATPVTAEQVQRLLKQLDAEDFRVRERASQELLSLGYQVQATLRSLVEAKNTPPETGSRAERILSKLEQASPELRFYRAIAALEYMNSRPATALLVDLAEAYPLTEIARQAVAASKRFHQTNQELSPK
jgi:WD40 repeat protein